MGSTAPTSNDLDIAEDGTIYVSNASSVFGNEGADPIRETLENRPHGLLIAYTPASGEARVLLTGFYFANGVTVIDNDSAVLVAELTRYRITRYSLTGERAGTADVFADNLPGMPDGIMSDRDGTVWVSLGSPRDQTLDTMHRFPFLKQQMAKLPDAWLTATSNSGNSGLVLGLDAAGRIITSLSESEGRFNGGVSNVTPHEGKLYLGTRYGRVKLVSIRSKTSRRNRVQQSKRILVTGATGKQGGAVARHLLNSGFTVRALTRKLDSLQARRLEEQGVELVLGNLEDPGSLQRATTEVDDE